MEKPQLKLTEQQTAIVTAAAQGGSFRCEGEGDTKKCRTLNSKGFLRRDPKDGALWYPTDAARTFAGLSALVEAEDAPGTELAPVASDSSGLVQMVERARALLDDGDVMAARVLSGGGYLQAKAAAQFASSFGAAGKRVLAKARQLQGDALLIETRAKIRIAAAFDEAQAEGNAAKRGRPKNIPDENIFTQEEAGLSAKEIHEARKLAAAEERQPGLVERAIEARLRAGLEPSRANLRAAVGTASATKEERGNNLYETPPEAMHTLLALEQFGQVVWEPACGRGAISHLLEEAGCEVHLSDLVDYGTADSSGMVQEVIDFLATDATAWVGEGGEKPDIVTNPPYGAILNAFVAHALKVHRPRKMALLLNFNFYCGFDDPDREFALENCPPARIHVFKRRLPMMHRDGWDGPEAASRMNTAWFVWERQPDGTYGTQTLIDRVDWKHHMPGAVEEGGE